MDTVPQFKVCRAGGSYTQLRYLKPIALRTAAGSSAELLECEVVLDSHAELPVSPDQRALRLRAHQWRSLPVGGGQTLAIGDRVTFRINTGSGDELYFVGDLSNAVVGFDGGESLRLIFTGVKTRLDDRTIHGQVTELADESVAFLPGLACVFNPGGLNNRRPQVTDHHPCEPGCTRSYHPFVPPDSSASPWSVAKIVEYLFNVFVTDGDITKPYASSLEQQGLDVTLDDVNVEGMTVSAAVDSLLGRIGFRWALTPVEAVVGSNEYHYEFHAFAAGDGTQKSLKLAAPGSEFSQQTTNLAAGCFNFDAGSIVNEVEALGGTIEVEALFSTKDSDVDEGAVRLYRGWEKDCEGQSDTPTPPSKSKDRYFIPYIKGHKDNTKWDDPTLPTRDVGRRFVVNETGIYADSGEGNSPPYPHPDEPGDLAGLLGEGRFTLRRRHFLSQRIQTRDTSDDRPEELSVEIYSTTQAAWVAYAGQVRFLPDELGIAITTKDITKNDPAADPDDFHCPRKDQPILIIDPETGETCVADIRFRAAIEMDAKAQAIFGKRSSDTGGASSPTSRTIRRTVTPAAKYRIRLVHHSASSDRTPDFVGTVKFGDLAGQSSQWSFSGVDLSSSGNTGELSSDSGSYGRLTARLSQAGAAYKVEVFKGELTDKVAEGSRPTPNGTMALEEANDSGLTGSVEIEYRQDADDIVLQLYGAVLDETPALESCARHKRDALEAMAISGCPVVPWICGGYELGDVITEVDGRDLSLQANDTSAAEDKRYVQVIGIVWHLDEEQSTELLLDDARQQQA